MSSRRSHRSPVLPCLLVLLAALGSRVAHAQPAPNAAAAQARFDRGRELFQANDVAAALEEFRTSLDLFRSPNSRLYVGLCLQRLGRLAEAYTELTRATAEATDLAATDRRYAATRDRARQEATALEGRIGRLTVRAVAAPDGLLVRVAGFDVPAQAMGLLMPYDPGDLVVTAEAPGYELFQRTVHLEPGSSEELAVTLELAYRPPPTRTTPPPRAAASRPAPPAAAPMEMRGGGLRTAGYVVGALGLASLAAFGGLAALTQSQHADLDRSCRPRCPTDRDFTREIDQGERYQLLANIALGVGAAGVVLGTIFIAAGGPSLEPARSDGRRSRASLRPWIDPARALVGLDGAF